MSSGTNKERITQNNTKIEELIDLVKTKSAGVSVNANAIIRTAELSGVTLELYNSENVLQESKPAGQVVDFVINTYGTYTIKAIKDSAELWTNSVEINEIGVYNVKSGKALTNYTWEELHEACQGGYAQYMFSLKDKYTYVDSGSIYNDTQIFIENFIVTEDNKTRIKWRVVKQLNSNYNITTNFAYLASADATSFSNTYANKGGMKYSSMRQRMQENGEEVWSQATGIKPDGSTIETGIEFSNIKYTDTGLTSGVYTYDETTDTMTQDTEYNMYWASASEARTNCKFVKGYFKSVGTITEEVFNAGTYYTYDSYVYTPATTYSSSTTYYGFYEFLQEDGVFLAGLDLIRPYLVKETRKASVGGGTKSGVSEFTDYVGIPGVEEITGINRNTVLFIGVSGTSIDYYNVEGEGTKQPCYDDFQMQVTSLNYWTCSSDSNSTYNFFRINNSGSASGVISFGVYGVRAGFTTN